MGAGATSASLKSDLFFFVKVYFVGTHLNCIDEYTGCNLKTMESLDGCI